MDEIVDIRQVQFTLDAQVQGKQAKKQYRLKEAIVRFAGDSGDGIQLVGNQFTHTTAIQGNDLSTFSDFPAEIRAPEGTIAGVSGFQIHFSSRDIATPGDLADIIVAMNPAALKANIPYIKKDGVIIINEDTFTKANLSKAGMDADPRESSEFSSYRYIAIPINQLTIKALKNVDVKDKDKEKSKNMFALGVTYWLFGRTIESTVKWIGKKFHNKPLIAKANTVALKSGYNFGETTELLPVHFSVPSVKLEPGIYRNITGNEALSLGLITASKLSHTPLLLGAYPITPSSDILHYLSKYKHFRVRTFQAEDEIAALSSVIGASFAGYIGVTATSGPGFALKSEALNLAVMMELPVVVINLQRGGPSTGLPTKTEQTDLLQVMFGRNGESPLCVIAAKSASDCFYKAVWAIKIATHYMVPVILLSDSYLANSAEPWKLPKISELPPIDIKYHDNSEEFYPYSRDESNLTRPWAIPGTPGLEHRVGGLEKENITGNVNYTPQNHADMVELRAKKVNKIQAMIPPINIEGDSKQTETLVISWGSTYGVVKDAVTQMIQDSNAKLAHVHLDFISPFPSDIKDIANQFKNIYVAELNTGQLALLLEHELGRTVQKINKVTGHPFFIHDIVDSLNAL